MTLAHRPRRLRSSKQLRAMIRETKISKDALIYPLFIIEGYGVMEEIPSMEGQYRYSIDRLNVVLEQLKNSGIYRILLFGIPKEKDCHGSGAVRKDGIIQKAIAYIKAYCSEFYIITDVCMCEYTSHGHCGILIKEEVDNDQTIEHLAQIALSHAIAGADMVAPSDMMDGRVGKIRKVLDEASFTHLPIMSYSVKYASAFYGPFREAAGSTPSFGNRKSYQMDYYNRLEALKEAQLDQMEGADILMVKPALSYLDIIRDVANAQRMPIAAYSVSGEYSMIKAAAKAGIIDEEKIICETTVSIFRAGASILITYFALELAKLIDEGKI